MKKGFTLVELLIVVVILVTLMSMVFRIGNIGSESEKRSVTIQRIQRLENALSGFYAAFGMYPPVKIHASRNIYLMVDEQGRQSDGQENTNFGSPEMWRQVEAACRAQPMGCEFPFDKGWSDQIASASAELPAEAGVTFDDGVSQNMGRFAPYKNETDWSKIKLFKFGVLSYLLPRYLFMMNGDQSFFTSYAQWTGNNTEPADAMTGDKMSWQNVRNYTSGDDKDANTRRRDLMRVANVPSQAVCARWIASLENTLACNSQRTIFGVKIQSGSSDSVMTAIPYWDEEYKMVVGKNRIYYPDGEYNGSNSNGYILDAITMNDGWGNELYYYSPSPHQNYQVWSSGPNGKTFAPWVARDKLPGNANAIIAEWTKDDIVSQSN